MTVIGTSIDMFFNSILKRSTSFCVELMKDSGFNCPSTTILSPRGLLSNSSGDGFACSNAGEPNLCLIYVIWLPLEALKGPRSYCRCVIPALPPLSPLWALRTRDF